MIARFANLLLIILRSAFLPFLASRFLLHLLLARRTTDGEPYDLVCFLFHDVATTGRLVALS
jgi:hypothetical protein